MANYLKELERERRLEKIRGKAGPSSNGAQRAAAPAAPTGKVKLSRERCGPRKGTLSTADRDRLPGAAFGLTDQRKYPLYVVIDGEGLPDREHAVNAKARAAQQFDRGRLSRVALGMITQRADKVIALCDRIEGA